MRIMAFSSSNRYSASARASSVLPTPVGPRKRKEPRGRLGSCRPALARRTAFATRGDSFVLAYYTQVQLLFILSSLAARPQAYARPVPTSNGSPPPQCHRCRLLPSAGAARCRLAFKLAQLGFQSRNSPYCICDARAKSVLRWAVSSSAFARSIFSLMSRTAFNESRSDCQRTEFTPLLFQVRDLFVDLLEPLLTGLVLLFLSASRSICNCITRRSTSSSATGILSASIRSRAPPRRQGRSPCRAEIGQ